MTSRRVFVVAVLCAGLGLLVTMPGAAASRNPADAMLDGAREALRSTEFSGEVRLVWRDNGRRRRATINVAVVDGMVRVADGQVLEADGHAWMRTRDRWTTIWTDARDHGGPSIAAKYRTRTRPGTTIAGRSTRELIVRRGATVVERIFVDQEFGFVLGRDRYDASRRADLRMRFLSLRDLRPRWGTSDVPPVGSGAPTPMRDTADADRRIGDGFVLMSANRVAPGSTQLRYSDGVFELSVFTRAEPLDWDALPAGARSERFGSVRARHYSTAAGSVIVWQSGSRTITCVTDAPRRDQALIVADLASTGDRGWTAVVRFVTGPFSWN